MTYGFMPTEYWNVVFKISGDSESSKLELEIEAKDKKGGQVFFVDDSGKPAQPPKTGQSFIVTGGSNGGAMITHPIFMGFPIRYQPEFGGRVFNCGIDPKYLSGFTITLREPKRVEFRDIPLDPVKGDGAAQ
jgi:hypothetical protein